MNVTPRLSHRQALPNRHLIQARHSIQARLARPLAGSVALAAALLLAACSIGGRPTPAPSLYDLGPPAARLAAASALAPLAVEVRAPQWLDSPGIDYRLAYADAQRTREYAGSRWVGPPADLLAQRLRQQLGAAAATSNLAALCVLRIDLQEFSQRFDSEEKSAGVIHAQAFLLDPRRRFVAGRSFTVERAAASADARGGAAALLAASDTFGGDLASWLARLEPTTQRACAGRPADSLAEASAAPVPASAATAVPAGR